VTWPLVVLGADRVHVQTDSNLVEFFLALKKTVYAHVCLETKTVWTVNDKKA